MTVTLAVLLVVVPPAFVQERVNVYVPAVESVTVWEPPLTALLPLHPVPPAVQEVGFFPVVHVTVVLLPAVIVLGETDTETVGFAMTVMLTDLEPEPALLLHERVKVYVPAVVITPVLCEPFADFAPVHDALPLAVQLVGLFVADQVRVELLPVPILLGLADIETTGGLAAVPLVAVTPVVALPVPPAFVQLSVYVYGVAEVASDPVDAVPLLALVPLQRPLAVQLVGLLVADHVRFELPPEVTDIGLALIVTTGLGTVPTVSGTLFAYPVRPALVQLRL